MLTRNQEVRRCLSVRRLVSHFNEVLPRLRRLSIVDHLSFIDYADFVKQLVQNLRSLVNGDDRCETQSLCRYTERADEFNGGGGI